MYCFLTDLETNSLGRCVGLTSYTSIADDRLNLYLVYGVISVAPIKQDSSEEVGSPQSNSYPESGTINIS